MPDVGLILLAAGASSRMGRPKQLLPFRGMTLVRYCARVALDAGCRPVVVIGANAEAVRKELEGVDGFIEENRDWEKGPGTSVRAGLAALLRAAPDVAGTLITLVDQPLITAEDLRELTASETGIAAAAFEGTVGSPAYFGREYFEELSKLPDGVGAKVILIRAGDKLRQVPIPCAGVDVDTPEQFDRLMD
jgi:molybdenum cofactor cytidylyltransferase